jgi:hypothetical protein
MAALAIRKDSATFSAFLDRSGSVLANDWNGVVSDLNLSAVKWTSRQGGVPLSRDKLRLKVVAG